MDPEFGCTYMTSYDQGDFDERLDAQGLSGWYTQAPAAIAAQVTLCTIQHSMQFAAVASSHTPIRYLLLITPWRPLLQVRLLLHVSPFERSELAH